MKIFFNESLKFPLRLECKRKYSEDFSFIPIKCVYNDKKIPLIIQTPQMFIPYGIDPKKNTVCISFQNKENDPDTQKLLDDLNHIHDIIKSELKDKYNINHFFKENIYCECMQLKISKTTHHFNSCKEKITEANCFSYGSFKLIYRVYGYRVKMYGFVGISFKVVSMKILRYQISYLNTRK